MQLFSIAISRPGAPQDGPGGGSQIQKFARPLGALVVVMGLLVLVIGESESCICEFWRGTEMVLYGTPFFHCTIPSCNFFSSPSTPLLQCSTCCALTFNRTGSSRYYRIQSASIQGNFPLARGIITWLPASLASLVSIVFGVLVTVPR